MDLDCEEKLTIYTGSTPTVKFLKPVPYLELSGRNQ